MVVGSGLGGTEDMLLRVALKKTFHNVLLC